MIVKTTPPIRFQQFLEIIHQYLEKRGHYQEHIAYFQKELAEETCLREILESFDESEFQNLRHSIESFLDDYEEEVKESRDTLDELARELKDIIHHNNRLLQKNKSLEKFYQDYAEQTRLTTQRVQTIEDKISDIYQLLRDNDRIDEDRLLVASHQQTTAIPTSLGSASPQRFILPKIKLPFTFTPDTNLSHSQLFREPFALTQFKLAIDFKWCPSDTTSDGILAILKLDCSSGIPYQLKISSPTNHYGKSALHLYLIQEGKVIHHGSILEYAGQQQNITQLVSLEIGGTHHWNLSVRTGKNKDRLLDKIPPIYYRGERYYFEEWLKKKHYPLPSKLGNICLGGANALPITIQRMTIQAGIDC